MRVLYDLNVVMDVLARRDPFYAVSAQACAVAESGRVEGYLATHTLTTLFYLLARHLDVRQATLALHDVLRVYAVAAVDQAVIETALTLAWDDFEDEVQIAAAMQIGADYLVTRNPTDFRGGTVRVLRPGEFITLV